MRLLTLKIQEPVPGHVLPEMAAIDGPEEAARRYRAIVVTTLRQLRGLGDARLRLEVEPADADEAVRFWLLPRLAEKWRAEEGVFHSEGWEIDFGGNPGNFDVHATGEILCPNLGARWVHAALLGMGRTATEVIGPATDGGVYFTAIADGGPADLPSRILPELPVIRTSGDWQLALDGILGPALKKAWELEGHDA
ncbi:hypothetical protein JIN84_18800 [Luteolibacter yonseiensis]|uniref:Uncharacterized protein n=1 Tax=Luteolibacter yonseiensis TaxID=1144680 RepID=A0A934R9I3_9BACT|nr:hypothetical protein [Luteolibacter yonseiensis]MBK1817675.1 hypothetical protein [Luteolibacter yonseiensis]